MPREITAEEIKQVLSYDRDTGLFTWLVDCGSNKVKGKIAGAEKEGYITIHIDSQQYRAHILAWIYVYGYTPDELDHENRIKSDNRIKNLRLTTRVLNAQNRAPQSRNTSGVSGVCLNKKSGKWRATLTTNGEFRYLGEYLLMEDAISARLLSEKEANFGVHHA